MKLIRACFIVWVYVIPAVQTMHAQWIPTGGPMETWMSSLAVGAGVAGNTILYAAGEVGCVFRSTNKGTQWTEIDGGTWWTIPQDTGFTRMEIRILAACGNGVGGTCLFAVDERGALFRSINADTNWVKINVNSGPHCIVALYIDKASIYAGTDSGCLLSTDMGASWQSFDNELTPYRVCSFVVNPEDTTATTVIAGTTGGVFASTDSGTSWTLLNADVQWCYGLTYGSLPSGTRCLYGFSDINVLRSTDDGTNWETTGSLIPYTRVSVACLAVHDTVLYAGTDGYGMFFSLDGGGKWVEGNKGMTRRRVHSFAVMDSCLFAGVDSDIGDLSSVWYRPLSEMLTSVHSQPDAVPDHFGMSQNYPNPFNPSTTIAYALPHRSNVQVDVYDILGQQIAVLQDGEQEAGSYKVRFHGSNLASGVYICRIAAGKFLQSAKMLLQR